METITTIVDTVFELVKAVLSPLGHLDEFIDGISKALGGSSDLSSATDVDGAGADLDGAGDDANGDENAPA